MPALPNSGMWVHDLSPRTSHLPPSGIAAGISESQDKREDSAHQLAVCGDQVRNISRSEQLAGSGLGQQLRIDARVSTRSEKGVRALAVTSVRISAELSRSQAAAVEMRNCSAMMRDTVLGARPSVRIVNSRHLRMRSKSASIQSPVFT
jgi:hypothetical protein